MKIKLTISLFLLLFLTIRKNHTHAQSLPEISKKEVSKMIDYIHEQYRDDYTSFGNTKIVDWQKANVSMMFTHAYEVLGDKKYLNWANDALYVEYNLSDDQCWGANAILELNKHGIFPEPRTYKDEAGKIFTMNYSYQDIFDFGLTSSAKSAPAPYFGFYDDPEDNGNRGIFWNRNFSSYNTCTLGQAIILAFRMPEQEINHKSPQEFASTWLRLQNDLLTDKNSGLIFDNYQLRSKQSNKGNYSYNNGIVLGAIGLAYQMTPKQKTILPETEKKIVDYVVNRMTESGVLCSPSADFNNHNAHAFNGIFMHFIPYYLFSNGSPESKNLMEIFIEKCATAIWNQIHGNNKIRENLYSVSYSWAKPYQENETNCMTTISAAECLLTYLQLKENILPVEYQKK